MFPYFRLVLLNTYVELGVMNTKHTHIVTVTDEQLRLLEAVKNSPAMLENLTRVLDSFNREVEDGMDAFTAESHIVEAVTEIGRSMIGQWAEKEQQVALDEVCKKSDQIKHGKKNSTGIAPSEESTS